MDRIHRYALSTVIAPTVQSLPGSKDTVLEGRVPIHFGDIDGRLRIASMWGFRNARRLGIYPSLRARCAYSKGFGAGVLSVDGGRIGIRKLG